MYWVNFYNLGKSVAQVSMKWLLQKDVVSAVIFGAKTVAQLEDNMGTSGDWALTTEQVQNLVIQSYLANLLVIDMFHYLYPDL